MIRNVQLLRKGGRPRDGFAHGFVRSAAANGVTVGVGEYAYGGGQDGPVGGRKVVAVVQL